MSNAKLTLVIYLPHLGRAELSSVGFPAAAAFGDATGLAGDSLACRPVVAGQGITGPLEK